MRLTRLLQGFRKDQHGSVLVEIAMSISIITGIVMGGFELARFSLVHQKMNRLSAVMADLITRAERLNRADFCNTFNAASFITDPFSMVNDGQVILTYVEGIAPNPGDPPVNEVVWQELGPGTLAVTSSVGSVGPGATLPNGRALDEGEGVVVAEVFYEFSPILVDDLIPPRQITHLAMLRPRYGALGIIDAQPAPEPGFPNPCPPSF